MSDADDRWVDIKEATRRANHNSPKPVTRRTMLRRLTAFNRQMGGNILRHTSPTRTVRKWWVNLVKLDEFLANERARRMEGNTREELDALRADVDQAHDRIDALDTRTAAQSSRLAEHTGKFKKMNARMTKHEMQLAALKKAAEGLNEFNIAGLQANKNPPA